MVLRLVVEERQVEGERERAGPGTSPPRPATSRRRPRPRSPARSGAARSCPTAAPRPPAASSGRGRRPAGRSRTACCPRCRCSAGRGGPENDRRVPGQVVDQVPEVEPGDRLERQEDQERHRPEEVARPARGGAGWGRVAWSGGLGLGLGVGLGVAGERGLADGPDEPLFQRRPPQVELAERPAVLDDPLGQRLAEVGPVLGLDLEPGDVALAGRSGRPASTPGRRLQRLADRLRPGPGPRGRSPPASGAGRAGRRRRSCP